MLNIVWLICTLFVYIIEISVLGLSAIFIWCLATGVYKISNKIK